MIGWRLVLVESRVLLLLIVVPHCQRHELTWLASVPMEKRRFHCCHQQLIELSRMLQGFSAVSTSSRGDVFVVSCTSVGTEGAGHQWVIRHEGWCPAVRALVFIGHPQRTQVYRYEQHSLKSSHSNRNFLPVWCCVSATHLSTSSKSKAFSCILICFQESCIAPMSRNMFDEGAHGGLRLPSTVSVLSLLSRPSPPSSPSWSGLSCEVLA